MNLCIAQIAEACGGRLVLRTNADAKFRVSSVVLDSRLVTEGGVFVATVGERVDGHKFIPDVLAKGACLVVAEKTPEQVEAEHGVSKEDWGNYILVDNSFQALKDIAEAYRKTLSIPIVGITGSVGKTSTKEYIAGVLAEKYHVLKTEGNFNNEIGVPLTLLRIRKEHQAAVVEMGINQFGEMHRLSKMVRPNVCVITNIGDCHLENLGTRDGVLKAKSEIFDYMAEDGVICLNGDDVKLSAVTEVKGKKTHFFGLDQENLAEKLSDVEGRMPFRKEVCATNIVSKGLWGSEAVLHIRKEQDGLLEERTIDIQVSQPGRHMVINAAAAACVGTQLGLSEEQIAEGIRKVVPVTGRNHLIQLPDCTLIDDCYNANPISMKAALDLLQMADGEKVAILGDMFELGAESDAMHFEIGMYAIDAGTDRLYCVGESARHMYEAAVKRLGNVELPANTDMVAGPGETRQMDVEAPAVLYFASRQLLEEALQEKREELLPKGCTILLKASHGMQFEKLIEKKLFE